MSGITVFEEHKVPGLAAAKQALDRDAQADSVIAYALRMKDWPLLEEAVSQKLDEQTEFVRWWREVLTVRHGAGRGNKNNTEPRSFSVEQAERTTGITQQRVSKWAQRLQDRDAYARALYGLTYRKAMAERGQSDLRGASGTGETEWYTPPEYLALARTVLGNIDLDPASSEAAQELVCADRFFTQEQDGLAQEWNGRIWLNPPYAQPHMAAFVSKMVEERRAGRITAAIMLTHNYTDTAWFHEAAGCADAICFTRGRVKFYQATRGYVAAPTQGQAFTYFGDDLTSFAETFSSVGFIALPWTGEA